MHAHAHRTHTRAYAARTHTALSFCLYVFGNISFRARLHTHILRYIIFTPFANISLFLSLSLLHTTHRISNSAHNNVLLSPHRRRWDNNGIALYNGSENSTCVWTAARIQFSELVQSIIHFIFGRPGLYVGHCHTACLHILHTHGDKPINRN